MAETYSKRNTLFTASAASTFDLNWNLSRQIKLTLTGDVTISRIQGGVEGEELRFFVAQDATGSRSLTWPGAIIWVGDTAPSLSSGGGDVDIFTFWKIAENTYKGALVGVAPVGAGTGDVSSNTASSVNNELVLFNGTGGKSVKRATLTGLVKATSGVASAAVAGTDYLTPFANGDAAVTGLGLGTAALLAEEDVAPADHQHTPGEAGIDMSTAVDGQLVTVQADGTLKPETPTLAAFASDGLAPVNGSILYGEGGAWVTKTLQEILTLAGKDKVGIPFAIPEITSGDFPICPYVPKAAAGTITACYVQAISGTQQIAVKKGGVTITGLSAVNVSSTVSSATATALNTIAEGNVLTGTVNSGSSPVRGMGILLVTTAV